MPTRTNDGRTLVVLINGILTRPSAMAWTDKAAVWLRRFTDHEVMTYEYFHTPLLGRLLGERHRVREAAELIGRWSDELGMKKVHLVGHSRGCEIIRRLIVERGIQVCSAHLFAAAMSPDLERNGLAAAMRSGRLDRLRMYCSRADWVLKYAAGMSLGLYGRAGYTGLRSIEDLPVQEIWREGFGHGDWFAAPHFGHTMRVLDHDLEEILRGRGRGRPL